MDEAILTLSFHICSTDIISAGDSGISPSRCQQTIKWKEMPTLWQQLTLVAEWRLQIFPLPSPTDGATAAV